MAIILTILISRVISNKGSKRSLIIGAINNSRAGKTWILGSSSCTIFFGSNRLSTIKLIAKHKDSNKIECSDKKWDSRLEQVLPKLPDNMKSKHLDKLKKSFKNNRDWENSDSFNNIESIEMRHITMWVIKWNKEWTKLLKI